MHLQCWEAWLYDDPTSSSFVIYHKVPPKHLQAHNIPLSCKPLPDIISENVLSWFPSQSHKSITCPVNSWTHPNFKIPPEIWNLHIISSYTPKLQDDKCHTSILLFMPSFTLQFSPKLSPSPSLQILPTPSGPQQVLPPCGQHQPYQPPHLTLDYILSFTAFQCPTDGQLVLPVTVGDSSRVRSESRVYIYLKKKKELTVRIQDISSSNFSRELMF